MNLFFSKSWKYSLFNNFSLINFELENNLIEKYLCDSFK